ncbi:protein FAM133-like isoform X1 [Rhincodon typus]|uniref:protein FAM133-like isoform X1 n=2 Tax=Rhincodon typus TaxID=259920 RepID=UPI0020301ED0|nr:protein FAM133-like isoform X1 [Rhincodon typus]
MSLSGGCKKHPTALFQRTIGKSIFTPQKETDDGITLLFVGTRCVQSEPLCFLYLQQWQDFRGTSSTVKKKHLFRAFFVSKICDYLWFIMERRIDSDRRKIKKPSTSSEEQKKRDRGKTKRERKRSRSRSSSTSSSSSSSSSLSSSSSSRSRSSSRDSQKQSKIKKRKKEKQHKKGGKKEKIKKHKKKKNVCSGPVQISKFLKDRDRSDTYSMITGKKIKMKVKKTKDDKERDRNRAELLQFLNSAMLMKTGSK